MPQSRRVAVLAPCRGLDWFDVVEVRETARGNPAVLPLAEIHVLFMPYNSFDAVKFELAANKPKRLGGLNNLHVYPGRGCQVR